MDVKSFLDALDPNGNNATKDVEGSTKSMDSQELEKERGTTITSKVTRLPYLKKNGIINIVDTPGHVDFSGEVDRIVHLINGICLVVDINEGVLSQTKYALQKALNSDENLRVALVLNKCDNAIGFESRVTSGAIETQVLDLFDTSGVTDAQMDYNTTHASARSGWFTDDIDVATKLSMDQTPGDDVDTSVQILLNSIWSNLPSPPVNTNGTDDNKFSFIVNNIGSDTYLGKLCTGKIHSGSIKINDNVTLVANNKDDSIKEKNGVGSSLISGMFVHQGADRVPLSSNTAYAGDIVTLAGIPNSSRVGDTITLSANPVSEPIHSYPIPQPILSVEVGPNTSPFLGQEGGVHVTSTKIYNRLFFEMENNISLNLKSSASGDAEKSTLFGRGTLQLGILFEQMRRDGYEFTISPPTILLDESNSKEKKEPYEEVIVDIPFEYQGSVMNLLTSNRGIFLDMENYNNNTSCKLYFELPTSSLMGMHMELASMTKGCAVLNHSFLEYRPIDKIVLARPKRGKLVSNDTGKATLYTLENIMQRGTLFIKPGDKVYPGMVIGERTDMQKDVDLEVNPVKSKQVNNIRAAGKDEKMYVPPHKKMTMEELISYMDYDEVVEITPQSIRLRKKELDASVRSRLAKNEKKRKLSAKQKK